MKQIWKYLFLLAVGGTVYCLLETLFRGYTHWSMFFVGGICFILCGLMNEVFDWMMPLVLQMLACAVVITAVEFATGLILNIRLGLGIWDYSNIPLNVLGQICLPFSALWFLLSAPAIILDDFLRWKFFGEEKPTYVLW